MKKQIKQSKIVVIKPTKPKDNRTQLQIKIDIEISKEYESKLFTGD